MLVGIVLFVIFMLGMIVLVIKRVVFKLLVSLVVVGVVVVVLILVVMGSTYVVFLDIVVCSVLNEVVGVVKYDEESLIEDISELDCFSDVVDDVWKVVVFIDRKDIEDGINEINLVALVDIFTGTSDIISGVVIDVVIIVEISAVDMSTTDDNGVCKSETMSKILTT